MKEVLFKVNLNNYKGGDYLLRENSKQMFLSHEARISIIYEHVIHGKTIRQLSHELGRSYSSIRSVIHAYLAHGHTNRMRNYQ